MIVNRKKEKSLITKLLEQFIRILLKKECKKIRIIKINILSTQIFKGKIKKLNVIAEDIHYKDFLFDEVELEAENLKINFNLINKELYFANEPIIKFKVSLSQKSLKKFLLSNKWKWITNLISMEILNQKELEDINIRNNQMLIKDYERILNVHQENHIHIGTNKGKIYLENKKYDKFIQIPMEDKIYIKDVNIKNDLINIYASSTINF